MSQLAMIKSNNQKRDTMKRLLPLVLISSLYYQTVQADWIHNIKNTLPVPVVIKTTDELGTPDWFFLGANEYGRIWFGGSCIKAFTVFVADSDKQKLEDSLKAAPNKVTRHYKFIDSNYKARFYDTETGREIELDLAKYNDYDLIVNTDGSIATSWRGTGGAGNVAWIKNIINTSQATISISHNDVTHGGFNTENNNAYTITMNKPVPWDNNSDNYFYMTITTNPSPYDRELAQLKPTQVKELSAVLHIPLSDNRCTWKNVIISYSKRKVRGSHLVLSKVDGPDYRSWGKEPNYNLNDRPRPISLPAYEYLQRNN